jgi:hypothetical protein
VQPEVLQAAEVVVQHALLKDNAGGAADFERFADDVVTGHDDLSGGGPDGRGENANGCGLAGAVRPEQAEDLSGRDFE